MPLFNPVTAPADTPLLDAANTFTATETFTPATAAGVPVVVKGAAGQTGNLQQWQNSAGTVLHRLDKGGYGNPPGLTLYGLANPAGGAAAAGAAGPGGNLAAGTTYYYLLTAVDYSGRETPQTATFSLAEGGTPTQVNLSWTSFTPANAQYINIYKGTSATVSALRLLAQVASSATAYTDDGTVATTSQAPPAGPPLIGGLSVAGVGSVFTQDPLPTANYGVVNIGGGAFDGSTTGKFVGVSGSGAHLAINAKSGYGGALIDAQVAGAGKFSVTAAGALTATTIDATKLTGTVPLASLSGITTSQLDAAAAITSGQVASLAASKLTGSHTLPDATLSTNVPLLSAANVFTAAQTGTALVPSGLTGATAAGRFVGATASGAPAGGTFAVGDVVIDQTGFLFVCTAAGTPGTWVQLGIDQKIAESVLGSSQNSVTFSAIPATFRHLRLIVTGRSDDAGFGAVLLQFNGDTAANYQYQLLSANSNTTPLSTQSTGQTALLMSEISGAAAEANHGSSCEATIYDYRGTTFTKSVVARGSLDRSSSTHFYVRDYVGGWANTAAITSVKVLANPSQNFLAGTVIGLYGLF